MLQQLIEVGEFNRFAGQDISDTPRRISKSDFYLQYGLIDEELKELKEAYDNDDYVEVLDALVDIQYVLLGMVCRLGMQYEFEKGFEKVHENNMTKIFDKNGKNITEFKTFTDSFGTERFKVGKPSSYERLRLDLSFPYLKNL